jgi:murein DD-endopeptidase MepM/ murein hydrolase activator NlpD
MTEIRLHSSDPRRPTRTLAVGPAAGVIGALLLMLAGNLVFLGLMAAPDLLSDLGRSADRFSLRETARVSAEAFESVQHRYRKLDARLGTAELFVARVALLVSVPLPDRFLAPAEGGGALTPDRLETEVVRLSRRLRALELFRRAVAEAPVEGAPRIPSRSPVEPSAAVPVATFGPRTSPLTHAPEFFPGIELAVPDGAAVIAPAAGTVVFSGPIPAKAGSGWRPYGTILVLSHGEGLRTVYGHLGKSLVRSGARVQRGDRIATAGHSGLAPSPRLHYEVRSLTNGRFLPLDPRLFMLDVSWITAAEIQGLPVAPADLDLPPGLR